MKLFVKEFLFYGAILPIIEKERITKGLESLSIPKCFYVHPDPGVLVMNNLKDMGFDLLKNHPRNSSTNFQDNEIILFMKSLASLHASTHHIIEQAGGRTVFLENYPDLKYIPRMPEETALIFKNSLEAIVDDAVKIANKVISKNAATNLNQFKPIAWETVDNSYYDSIGEYQTLVHGDSWQNNAMFR